MYYNSRWGLSFLISEDPPYSAPAELFTIADNRVSRHWRFDQHLLEMKPPEWGTILSASAGYPEYVLSDSHMLGLVEGQPADVEVFRRWKRILDLEFPHPDVTDMATPIGQSWVQCPFCADGWEARPADGMTRCSGCGRIMRNPLFAAEPDDPGVS
jgi:hypothetical protein